MEKRGEKRGEVGRGGADRDIITMAMAMAIVTAKG
jgi:hypothetical protein